MDESKASSFQITSIQIFTLATLISGQGLAQSVSFTEIVSHDTPIHGYGLSPALNGDHVAFLGKQLSTYHNGIFRAAADGSGNPMAIVMDSDPLPNVPGEEFVFLDNPDVDGGVVTFTAGFSFSGNNNTGIYQGTGGPVTVAYEHADPLAGPNPFEPMVEGNLMLMSNRTSSSFSFPYLVAGVNSAPSLITGTLPDGGDFISLVNSNDTIALGGGVAVICSRVGHSGLVDGGLYSWDSQTSNMATLANWDTDIPGTNLKFTDFWRAHTDGANCAFVGSQGLAGFGGFEGVYSVSLAGAGSGPLTEIARVGDLAPSSTEAFAGFGNVAIEGDLVVFEAVLGSVFNPTGAGIYGYKDSQVFRIIDLTQQLNGRDLIGVTFDFRGLDAGRLAFRPTFFDPAHPTYHVLFGVYVADIGEETTPFCLGDGSGSGCPCGNLGATGEGCSNSTSLGAQLSAQGTADIASDDLKLVALQLPPQKPGLFFSGNTALNAGSGQFFGDGLLCIGGSIQRLEVGISDAGGQLSSTLPIASSLGAQVGTAAFFQVWYRDPLGPCGAGFNFSSALELTWR